MRRALLLALGVAVSGVVAAPAASAADLRLGFSGYFDLLQMPVAEKRVILERMRSAGAEDVRIPAQWSTIATSQPPVTGASDPRWPGYDWRALDETVAAIAEARLTPLLVLNHAPIWAEAPRPPARQLRPFAGDLGWFPPGTWRPSRAGLRAFATAVARRYDGRTAGEAGYPLPRVRLYQAWNEPNLPRDLGPQFERRGRALRAVSPDYYRSMLNAVYAAVKSVDRTNVVLTGALAPFGDYEHLRPKSRVPPVTFARRLLCLNGAGTRALRSCPNPPRFDVFTFNTYPLSPRAHTPTPADLYIADAGKVHSALRVAERAHTALPRKHHPVWLTEFSWEAVAGRGLSRTMQARYLTYGLYAAWRQRIAKALWWVFRDLPDAANVFQGYAGVYTRGSTVADDRPRPALASFTFPFLAVRDGSRTRLWGLAPRPGSTVTVQQSVGGAWRRLAMLRARGRVFTSTGVRVGSRRLLRAVAGGRVSPAWRAP
jgi:hypothetical protein